MEYKSNLRNISFGKRLVSIISAAVFGFIYTGEIERNLGNSYNGLWYTNPKPHTSVAQIKRPEAFLTEDGVRMPWDPEENVSTNGKNKR